MPQYNNINLFQAGKAKITTGPIRLRYAAQPVLNMRGLRITAQGLHARSICQTGSLVGDNVEQLQQITRTIEEQLDGLAHTLTDDDGRSWPDTVMISFQPGSLIQLGPRWKLNYKIEYLQVMT